MGVWMTPLQEVPVHHPFLVVSTWTLFHFARFPCPFQLVATRFPPLFSFESTNYYKHSQYRRLKFDTNYNAECGTLVCTVHNAPYNAHGQLVPSSGAHSVHACSMQMQQISDALQVSTHHSTWTINRQKDAQCTTATTSATTPTSKK